MSDLVIENQIGVAKGTEVEDAVMAFIRPLVDALGPWGSVLHSLLSLAMTASHSDFSRNIRNSTSTRNHWSPKSVKRTV